MRIRAGLDGLPGYRAGRGAEAVRTELDPGVTLVQLAQNEDSRGPLPAALEAIAAEAPSANRYPESGSTALRVALAVRHNVALENVFVAGGSTAAIHYLSLALLEPGDEAIHSTPTFPAYRLEALKMGAVPVAVATTTDGSPDLDAMLAAVTEATRLVYIANPNNPTGGMVIDSSLKRFLERLPEHVLPVLDEAYFEYVDAPGYSNGPALFNSGSRPIVVLRTFSKIYGLAGLRVGYALCPSEVAAACAKVQVPFEVSRAAIAAAVASISDGDEAIGLRRAAVGAERTRTLSALRTLGYSTLPSVANFIQLPVGNADAVAVELEQQGVIVRPLTAWGVPEAIRVSIGTPAEMARFLEAFEALHLKTHSLATSARLGDPL